jgi:hypothetical protein
VTLVTVTKPLERPLTWIKAPIAIPTITEAVRGGAEKIGPDECQGPK